MLLDVNFFYSVVTWSILGVALGTAFLLHIWKKKLAIALLPCKLRTWAPQQDDPSPYVHVIWPCVHTKLHSSYPPTTTLSVIIPAYNEAQRLPLMLEQLFHYLAAQKRFKSVEILVVDDGSFDRTTPVALTAFQRLPANVRGKVVQLQKNYGKGSAVKAGMLLAQGEYLLFADADGATPFSELDKLMDAIKDIAIGSRAHLVNEEAVVNRSRLRNLLMHSFHYIVMLLGIRDIRDTQCGFKLFTRRVAQTLFPTLHVYGWIFDIELLLLASWLHYDVKEIPVCWSEIEGSKMSLATDSLHMLFDLLLLRYNYYIGTWKVPAPARHLS